jgi:hypothetical protein
MIHAEVRSRVILEILAVIHFGNDFKEYIFQKRE